MSEGELWKRQRYMMQPLFHRRVIAGFASVIDQANERLIARWTTLAARGEPANVTDEMSELTLDVMLHAVFGRDLERLERELGDNSFALITRESTRDLRFAWHFRSLTRVVAELIGRRRTEAVEHFDYVAMLMKARDRESGEPMSERQLIDEIMTLIVAGHETTASGLNWVWYLLAGHPEADARLHAEIDAAPEEPAPGLAAMEALRYARQVIDEALRLYPPGWLLSRRAIAADALSGCDLPAGADVLISPFLLHRHPGYWDEPEAFRPERFAPEHAADRSRFAYMPFAAGPRHCIGESFALYEMLIHLYRVARRFRLRRSTDEPIELEAQVNLRTRRPLMMRLERRA